MDWMEWIPTTLRTSRKTTRPQRRKQAKVQRPVESSEERPLVFHTSEDMCICQPMGAVLASPVLLGLSDSATMVGETGTAHLPSELLGASRKIAEAHLLHPKGQKQYKGPITLLKEAYKATRSPGATTVALAALDNSTVIHGQLHPMIAMLSLGGCELLQLRRRDYYSKEATASESLGHSDTELCKVKAGELEIVFRALPKTLPVDAEGEVALLNRDVMDTDIDTLQEMDAIEAKTCVQCASARLGDIIILTSAGSFTEAGLVDCVALCNKMLPLTPGPDFSPIPSELLKGLAQRVAQHSKCGEQDEAATAVDFLSDDSLRQEDLLSPCSVVVAQVVEREPIESRSSSSAVSTPEKICPKATPTVSGQWVSLATPLIEGTEDVKTVNCAMPFGAYMVSISVDLPKVDAPKWPLRRSLTNDFMCDLD